MIKQILLPAIIAFAVSAASGPVLIPFLQRLKAGQTVRDDGPQTHLAKNGTPTMGGFIFLIGFLVSSLCFGVLGGNGAYCGITLLAVFGFALIGFVDDYIKVVLKRSLGLRAWQKFSMQIVLAVLIIGVYIALYQGEGPATAVRIPLLGTEVDFGIWAYLLYFIAILGTVNGANFTDGLDGLATKVTSVIAVFFVIASLLLDYSCHIESAAMAGALLGFLLYNSHKASVFMGDTGSLALGGYVAITAMLMKLPLFILLIAFIYLAEVCSVILQVGYFKLTHGKRIFRMAPIHHHFELGGWVETKVVAVFTIVTIVLCTVSLMVL